MATTRNDQRSAKAARRAGDPQDAADAAELPFWRRVWDQVGPIGLAVLIALAIRAVIIESYYVPSGSMLSTMFIGDHVFVSKFTYGAHVPFTGVVLPDVRAPKRGEIAVFALGRAPNGMPCPLDVCSDSGSEGFVKRIVGLPGDTVEYKDGVVILNGKVAEQRVLDEEFTDENGVKMRVVEEDLDGCRHRVLDNPAKPPQGSGKYTIAPDHYFMMGDNRDNSNDSRFWGTVHRDHFKGPVLINYWSWNNTYSWLGMLNPINWIKLLFGEMRWDRIGMNFDCDSGAVPEPATPAKG